MSVLGYAQLTALVARGRREQDRTGN